MNEQELYILSTPVPPIGVLRDCFTIIFASLHSDTVAVCDVSHHLAWKRMKKDAI
jgi:hypothetical protein